MGTPPRDSSGLVGFIEKFPAEKKKTDGEIKGKIDPNRSKASRGRADKSPTLKQQKFPLCYKERGPFWVWGPFATSRDQTGVTLSNVAILE